MAKKWGIIGLGWLGKALANQLSELNIEYWGTTRKNFEWGKDAFPLESCDVLFLNTPPLVSLSPEEFVHKIPHHVGQIMFISSIGVYGECSGIITERTHPNPTTNNGRWLVDVEALLLTKFKDQITIIRPGGLIGGDRHPVFSLAKKVDMLIPDGVVNLIHRQDLVSIILAISALDHAIPIINAVAPYHPLKSEYYGQWCEKLGLGTLKFSSVCEASRIIESDKLNDIYSHWHCPELDNL